MAVRDAKALAVLCIGIVLMISSTAFAAPTTPTERIRSGVTEAQKIIESALGAGEKRTQLRRALTPWFDFTEMARRALGINIKKASEKEFQEFVPLFVHLIESTYLKLSTIEQVKGIEVVYLGERIDGTFAEVRTKIITAKDAEYLVAYRMHIPDGENEWKVYDVNVENISLIANYRSQFNAILSKSSFAVLLEKLRDKKIQLKDKDRQ